MYTKISLFSVFIFILSIVSTVRIGVKSKCKFDVTKNKRISAMNYRETVTQSTAACSVVCQSSSACNAANYLAEKRTCYLFNNTCFLTEDANGWRYLSRPLAQRTFIYISNRTETWDGAKLYCDSIGGALANIYTPSDHEMILSILSQVQYTYVWLGGSDREHEGEWIWTNGCRLNDQDFSFWTTGQPNNFGNNQHCLEVYTGDKLWNDMDCEEPQTFMCEINVA